MKLVVHELTADGLTQTVKPDKNVIVEAIRPHIYRHNWPTGNLVLQILDMSDAVVAESLPISVDDIGSESFFHGWVRFDIKAGLKKNTEYKIKLTATGYSFAESDFIGWCNDYDFKKYERGYDPASSLNAPLDVEVWERKVK